MMQSIQNAGYSLYSSGRDASAHLASTLEGASLLNMLAMNTVSVSAHYCKKACLLLPDFSGVIQVFDGTKELFGVFITKKRWSDLKQTVITGQVFTLKGVIKVTDTAAKSAGSLLGMGKYGAISLASIGDFQCAAKTAGGMQLFDTTAFLLKEGKKELTICSSVLRLADASYQLYKRTVYPESIDSASPKILAEQTHAKELFALQCARECSTLACIFIDKNMMEDVVLLGMVSTVILLANQLFTIYVIDRSKLEETPSPSSSPKHSPTIQVVD